MQDKDEKKCIASIKKGNLEEFEKIVDSYSKVLLHISFYIVGNKTDAEDLCQEAFIRLYKYIKSFIPKKGSLKGYLYKTIVNLSISFLNKKKVETFATIDENLREKTKDFETKGDIYSIINKLLSFLNPKERVVFVLREIEEMEYREIAKMLKLNEITIRRYNSMAREKLRNLIENNYPEYKELL